MKLIVVEGLDGAGKSTQLKMLREHFDIRGFNSKYLHFPRMEQPFFGELISKFLRGELGKLEDVHPYMVAMIYAGDRNDASGMINNWMEDGHYVLLDRYVYSNIAYQCAKMYHNSEREKLKEWILKLEFEHFGIPRPAINVFLDVPFSFTEAKLNENRLGDDREYLKGNSDIHEDSLQFQKNVRQVYIETADSEPTLEILDCTDNSGEIMEPGDIFNNIVNLLQQKNIIK